MRALSLLSVLVLALAACDAPDPAAFKSQRADTMTGTHVDGVDPGNVDSAVDTHWLEKMLRNIPNNPS